MLKKSNSAANCLVRIAAAGVSISSPMRILRLQGCFSTPISILSASEIFRVSTTSPMLQIIGRRMRTEQTPLARRMARNCILTIRGCFTRGFVESPGTGWFGRQREVDEHFLAPPSKRRITTSSGARLSTTALQNRYGAIIWKFS